MITFKCKMCGGDLHPREGASTCECEYCGSVQTIPTADNEKKMNLFSRAQRLLRACEFDKASGVYESIVAEFPAEAEAYWGLVLSKYGIEYVDDPATGKKIPTCHRTRSDSVMDDSDYEQACENADIVAKRVYREEAKEIDRLQQDIHAVVANEAPYDVFICYKETDENGERTEDSVLAQDIYDALTTKGLKVFFARITLEDKLGQQYEPYIYAALHSAKVMLVVGTQFEYFDAVWVKNEWARFLDMKKEKRAKTLIPCYKGISAYDMPREFKNLQAQDMGKLGWLQDLTRGVLKLAGEGATKGTNKVESQESDVQGRNGADSHAINLINKTMDSELQECNSEMTKVLQDIASAQEAFSKKKKSIQRKTQAEFDRTIAHLQDTLEGLREKYDSIKSRYLLIRDNPEERKKWIESFLNREEQYRAAQQLMQNKDYKNARDAFKKLEGLYDSANKAEECDKAYKEECYQQAIVLQKLRKWSDALVLYSEIPYYKDSNSRLEQCKKKLGIGPNTTPRTVTSANRTPSNVGSLPSNSNTSVKKKSGCLGRSIRLFLIGLAVTIGIIAIVGIFSASKTNKASKEREAYTLLMGEKYDEAINLYKSIGNSNGASYALGAKLLSQGNFDEAVTAFEAAGSFSGASEQLAHIESYRQAESLLESGDTDGAIEAFRAAGICYDAVERKGALCYAKAEDLLANGDVDGAIAAFSDAGTYRDSKMRIGQIYYEQGETALADQDYEAAIAAFDNADEYQDAKTKANSIRLEYANALIDAKEYDQAYAILMSILNYDGVKELIENTPELKKMWDEATIAIPDKYQGGAFVDGGSVNSNISWEYQSTGLLIITGEGEVTSNSAWRKYRSDVKYVSIEPGITGIGSELFRNHSDLEGISIANTVTTIGDRAFYYCTNLKDIVIPGSVQTIEEYMFFGSGVHSATILEGTTSIESEAFRNASSLETIVLPSTLTSIGDRAFYYCSELKEISIPGGVKSIPGYCFFGSGITSCTFGEGFTTVDSEAFRNANKLRTVVFPSTLTTIEDRAFYYCDLREVKLPKSLRKIGEYAFFGNSSLKTVYFAGTKEEWLAIDINDDAKISGASIYFDAK